MFKPYRIAFVLARRPHRTGHPFTHKNGDFGAIFVTKWSRSPEWRVTYWIGVHTIHHFHIDHNVPCLPPPPNKKMHNLLFLISPGYCRNPKRNRHVRNLEISTQRSITCNTNYYTGTFSPSTVNLWNTLPAATLDQPNIAKFKAEIDRFYWLYVF